MIRIGIVLFDGAEELDWAGPWEVMAAWGDQWPDDGVEVFTLSPGGGEVRCAKGLRVLADYSWDDAPAADVIVYPGGQGTRSQLSDETVLGWVRAQRDRGALMASVCTGALVFAAAGLLDGLPATTHWGSVDLLGGLGDRIAVRPDERFVDTGDVVTAAGVSAGIDMALHLIVRLHSPQRAAEVKRYIQYFPQPPV